MSYENILIGTVNGTSNGVNGVPLVINLNASSTVMAVDALIQNLAYRNTSDTPNASRTIQIVVNDGGGGTGTSTPANIVINVTAQNDVPVIWNLAADTLAYSEGAAATVIDQGTAATVADADSANFDTGTLTVAFVSGSNSSEDILYILDGPGNINVNGSNVRDGTTTFGAINSGGGSGGTALVITFDADATPENVGRLLRNITYQNNNTTDPTPGNRTVRFSLTDGDGGTSLDYDTIVTVTPINSAPTLAGVTSPVTFLENAVNTAAAVLDNDVTLADVDSADFGGGSVTVSYSSARAAQDQLSVNNQGTGTGQIGVSGSNVSYENILIGTVNGTSNGVNGVPLVINLNASSTVMAVDALIQNLAYRNTFDTPMLAARSRSWSMTVTAAPVRAPRPISSST